MGPILLMSRPVQAFQRGLAILEYLNMNDDCNANAVSKGTGLTRGTTYRLLETLRADKFVSRDTQSGRYSLDVRVRGLADGYSDEKWVDQVAQPVVKSLGRKVIWPLSLSTQAGTEMLIRVNTDFDSPLSENRFLTGHRMPILESASGLVYLTYCNEVERATLIELATLEGQLQVNSLNNSQKALENNMNHVRETGYARRIHEKRTIISIPIHLASNIFGCLAIRYFTSAVRDNELRERILPMITESRDKVEEDLGKLFS